MKRHTFALDPESKSVLDPAPVRRESHPASPPDISFPREDVVLVAGWSDRIFDMLAAVENGSDVIEEIKDIEL